MNLNEDLIQRIADRHVPNITFSVIRQAYYEAAVRLRKASFRTRENEKALEAYCSMSLEEFEGINARQNWANWKTIPRNLNGRIPNARLRAIDLCCGIGQSTQVLAYYLAQGSEILGYEFNPSFVELAGHRSYLNDNGSAANVHFLAQSVLETFRDPQGPLPDGCIDLVNSCGAVGANFNPDSTRILAREILRVLKPGALATIDAGPEGTKPKDLCRIFEDLGFETLGRAKSCAFDIFTQFCFRKR